MDAYWLVGYLVNLSIHLCEQTHYLGLICEMAELALHIIFDIVVVNFDALGPWAIC